MNHSLIDICLPGQWPNLSSQETGLIELCTLPPSPGWTDAVNTQTLTLGLPGSAGGWGVSWEGLQEPGAEWCGFPLPPTRCCGPMSSRTLLQERWPGPQARDLTRQGDVGGPRGQGTQRHQIPSPLSACPVMRRQPRAWASGLSCLEVSGLGADHGCAGQEGRGAVRR